MGLFDSPEQSQTTTTNIPKQAGQLLDLAMPTFKQALKKPVNPYPGQTTEGFDPSQVQGQTTLLGAVPGQQQVADTSAQGQQFLASGDVLHPASNPALKEYMDAATKPLYQNLTEVALPEIRGGAVTSGNFGSSRQGIAEGLGIGRTAQAAGETTANIANQGYNAGLDAMGRGIALAPTVQGAQAQPGLTQSGVGDTRQALGQAMRNQKVNDYYMKKYGKFLMAKDIAGIASGIPGGSTTTTASAPQQSPLNTILGAASTILPLFF